MEDKISELAFALIKKYRKHRLKSAFTVAISGIDAAGKGYISKQLKEAIEANGHRVALIHIDPWQNPIPVRLKKENAAENIYENMFRWDELFDQLVFPLKRNKSIYLETKGIRTDADIYYPLIYDFVNIDILFVEGIFLLKQQYLPYFDYKIWIYCSFETGLQRAIQRNVEKLDEEAVLQDYQTFYYPAQRYHFEKDDPVRSADLVYDNNKNYAPADS